MVFIKGGAVTCVLNGGISDLQKVLSAFIEVYGGVMADACVLVSGTGYCIPLLGAERLEHRFIITERGGIFAFIFDKR